MKDRKITLPLSAPTVLIRPFPMSARYTPSLSESRCWGVLAQIPLNERKVLFELPMHEFEAALKRLKKRAYMKEYMRKYRED